ncbi:MAG: TAXI family TRAP transporter solute-binding subunit [Hyphomicrobiales bacterium]|nr:TAXI family TRAP transporter solute-binding subunit [Hyphomicrobiales bacterium]MCP5374103.1 TAXI family TRAP transporter solute-binding subunit [Hyphomicrobiales bacterium]
MKYLKGMIVAGVAAAAMVAGTAVADGVPKKTTWTAYGTTTSGYAQSVAIGNMLKKHYDTNMRVIPGKNDISRMAPLRDGKADYCACGIASYFGQEGVFLFADKDWGPQPIRLLMAASGANGLGVAVAKDSGINSAADFKGKRVSWVKGGDALNWGVAAYLAFAGLTWDDVEKVEVSGFAASFEAIVSGQSDAAFASTVTGTVKKLEASPRGVQWVPLPHNDEAGWKRVQTAAPVYSKVTATIGATISKEHPVEMAGYPYPILIANADKSADEVYGIVKAMVEHFGDYSEAAKGAKGWALDKQRMDWAMPYHDGAIRYWKEKGIWTDAHQKHNDMLIKRQQVIQDAWKALPGKDGMEKDALKAAWSKARAAALTKAGFDTVFN